MGCLRKLFTGLGCLVFVVAAVALAVVYRDRLAALYYRVRGRPQPPPPVWVAAPPGAAARAESTLAPLARRGGPAYVDLTAGELAGLIAAAVAREPGGPQLFDSVAVVLGEGRVEVRGSLNVAALPRRLLGPLAPGLGGRERMVAGGTLAVAPGGTLRWTIDALKIGELPFPHAALPAILHAMHLPGLEGTALPIPLPRGAGDVRVHPPWVRLYRAAPR